MMTSVAGPTFLVLGVACGAYAVMQLRRDPRRLATAGELGAALLAVAVGATLLGSATFSGPLMLVLVLSPLLVSVLVGFLLWNGLTMVRKEGRSLGNLLSLLAGIGIATAVAVCLGLLVANPRTLPVSLWIVMACAWVAAVFCGYLGYSWLYQRLVRAEHPDFVVTLGSGLIGDRVPPLLAGRIDAAIEVYRREVAAGRHPVLVMSGGKGSDELLSEAEAMGRHAVAKGIAPDDLLLEDRSATTEQNLRNSVALVREDPRLGAGARGLAVTSNYHAMRAAVLARSLGVPVNVLGARTAAYFWPSAVLREFVAVLRPRLAQQLLVLLLVTLPLPAAFGYAIWFR